MAFEELLDDEPQWDDDPWQDLADYEEECDGMYIKLHGGKCCGVKHIHEMGESPVYHLSARSALTGSATSYGRHATTGINDAHADDYPEDFFCDEAPAETYGERLERLVKFLKKNRPHGIAEIILTSGQSAWFPFLLERDFKRVTPDAGVRNSNTTNYLHVFHLYY